MSQATTRIAQKDRLPPLWGGDESGYRIQPTAPEIVAGIKLRGGELWLDDNYSLRARLPKKNLGQWKELLKMYRPSVLQYLQEGRAKVKIPVACRCDHKPYAHLIHDPPRGGGEAMILFKGDLRQLSEALAQCQAQGPNWAMVNLIMFMEDIV